MPKNKKTDNWDTHSLQPYVSEFIKPFKERDPEWKYCLLDVFQETFALLLWKLQEEYHLDYQTAFLLAGRWRVLAPIRIYRMFGIRYPDELRLQLWEMHPEVEEIEKVLPKRNIPFISPYSQEDDAWHETSIEDWFSTE